MQNSSTLDDHYTLTLTFVNEVVITSKAQKCLALRAAYLRSRSLLAVSEALRKRRSVPRVRRQNTGGLNRQQTRRRNATSSAREDEQPTGPDYNPENPYHVSNAFFIKVMHEHRHIHTLPVKILDSSSHQDCLYLIKNTVIL